jgi:microcystin degradation protein MlrC
VTVTGTVRFAGVKRYVGSGPMRRGQQIDLGPCAVIDADGLVVTVISHSTAAIDLDPLSQFGFAPSDFDLVVLRSKTHFRAVWEPLAGEILIVDTPDWGPADLKTLPYRRVRPGVFPITAD